MPKFIDCMHYCKKNKLCDGIVKLNRCKVFANKIYSIMYSVLFYPKISPRVLSNELVEVWKGRDGFIPLKTGLAESFFFQVSNACWQVVDNCSPMKNQCHL